MPPVIDLDSCTACGTCEEVCCEDVFYREKQEGDPGDERPMVTHPEFCYHCYLCVKECPSEAIWLRTPLAMIVPYK